MKFHLLGAACTAITTAAASAATLLVPAHHATIQDAIDAAASGDVIMVEPGTYKESLLIDSKDLILTCTSKSASAIVDGEGTKRCLECRNLSSATTIRGFTFQNGKSPLTRVPMPPPESLEDWARILPELHGGGVRLNKADVQFMACDFQSNIAHEGSALYAWRSATSFTDCRFRNNFAAHSGTVTVNTLGRGHVTFEYCMLYGNAGGGVQTTTQEIETERIGDKPRIPNMKPITVNQTLFEANTGTALGVNRANLALTGSQFQNNDGDDVKFYYGFGSPTSGNGTCNVNKCTFMGSTGNGCISLGGQTDATISNSNFIDIVSTVNGGAISVHSGSLELYSNSFIRIKTDALYGGAINAFDVGELWAVDCDFSYCTSGVPVGKPLPHWSPDCPSLGIPAGGAFRLDQSTGFIESCRFEHCAAHQGGFISLTRGDLSLTSNTFEHGVAHWGAAIHAESDSYGSTMLLSHVYSHENTYAMCHGMKSVYTSRSPSIFEYASCDVESTEDTAVDNYAESDGSIVYVHNTSPEHPGSATFDLLKLNHCRSEIGNIFTLEGRNSCTLFGCSIRKNSCGTAGHLLFNNADSLHIDDCLFALNSTLARSYLAPARAVIHTHHISCLTHVSNTAFCRNFLVAFDGPWMDGGGLRDLGYDCW